MSELDNTRKKINDIDKQMASLYEERMKCSYEVAKYKMANALPIFDANREKEVIENRVCHRMISFCDKPYYFIL